MFPVKLPADWGAKVTLKDAVCPADRVRGVLMPDTLKPVPEAAIWEMVALAPPVF